MWPITVTHLRATFLGEELGFGLVIEFFNIYPYREDRSVVPWSPGPSDLWSLVTRPIRPLVTGHQDYQTSGPWSPCLSEKKMNNVQLKVPQFGMILKKVNKK